MKANLFFILIGFYVNSIAQPNYELHKIEVDQKIFKTEYNYNNQIISNPYGLQIPLMTLNDSIISNDYNIFKRAKKTAKIINLLSSGLSLYALFNSDEINEGAYWVIIGTSVFSSAFFTIRANVFLNKAITRYNNILMNTEFGFHLFESSLGNRNLGFGIAYKF